MYTSASGIEPHLCKQFDVSVSLAHADAALEMHLPSVLVIEAFFLPEEGIQAILGRDVLDYCLFIYDGLHGTYTLAF